MPEDWLEVYENRADRSSNNLRLKEISILTFFQFYFKINRSQLEIVVKTTYGLHPKKYFETLHLTLWGRSPVMKSFGLHSNSYDADEIKGLLISIDFRNRNTELRAPLKRTSKILGWQGFSLMKFCKWQNLNYLFCGLSFLELSKCSWNLKMLSIIKKLKFWKNLLKSSWKFGRRSWKIGTPLTRWHPKLNNWQTYGTLVRLLARWHIGT